MQHEYQVTLQDDALVQIGAPSSECRDRLVIALGKIKAIRAFRLTDYWLSDSVSEGGSPIKEILLCRSKNESAVVTRSELASVLRDFSSLSKIGFYGGLLIDHGQVASSGKFWSETDPDIGYLDLSLCSKLRKTLLTNHMVELTVIGFPIDLVGSTKRVIKFFEKYPRVTELGLTVPSVSELETSLIPLNRFHSRISSCSSATRSATCYQSQLETIQH